MRHEKYVVILIVCLLYIVCPDSSLLAPSVIAHGDFGEYTTFSLSSRYGAVKDRIYPNHVILNRRSDVVHICYRQGIEEKNLLPCGV